MFIHDIMELYNSPVTCKGVIIPILGIRKQRPREVNSKLLMIPLGLLLESGLSFFF